MKALSITTAQIAFDGDDGVPRSVLYGDVYHSASGALDQAREVFIGGNGLPQRWRDRPRFTILETGFGFGHNLLATIDAWRADPQRCTRLHVVSIDAHPPLRADLHRALAGVMADGSARARDAAALIEQWPPLVAGMHRLCFAEGAVTLDLVFADVHDALRELVCTADAVFLDGFAPARNPAMWDERLFRALARVVASDACAATWSVARVVRDGLALAGFDARRKAGFGGKRQMLVAARKPLPAGRKRYDVLARLGPARSSASPSSSSSADALVIGAGLAGAHVAAALAARGQRCNVIDRHDTPAHEASGGDAGIFHGTVHAADNLHARLHRAGSIVAFGRYLALLATPAGDVPAMLDGLLRRSDLALDAMLSLAQRQGLPPEWARAIDADEASALAGVPIDQPCWFFAHAGWISPRALVQHLLRSPGITFNGGIEITRIERHADRWCAFDAHDAMRATATVIVLANAASAATLAPWAAWPLRTSRGQSTLVPAATAGLAAPRLPVSSKGYALTLLDGSVLCGASAHAGDDDRAAREHDTRDNLDKLARLTGSRAGASHTIDRVAWRAQTPDRMPIVGAVPALLSSASLPSTASSSKLTHTQARNVPREPGLYALTGLGSRGLTLAALMAEVVAASIVREPVPIEASILDAIDAARFVARRAALNTAVDADEAER